MPARCRSPRTATCPGTRRCCSRSRWPTATRSPASERACELTSVYSSDANAADERQRGGHVSEPMTPEEREVVARQLGRPPRALRAVAHRCPCGQPDVVQTSPRLEDGTPFPTLYYLTCPRASAAASRLESTGRMREWQADLGSDAELATGYRAAHEAYLAERDALGELPTRTTAGGMPDRVK